jgi:hypothetical protein
LDGSRFLGRSVLTTMIRSWALGILIVVAWQDDTPRSAASQPLPGVAERLEYDVSFSRFHVATADMTLFDTDSAGGRRLRRAVLQIAGGIPFFRVVDSSTSWFDSATFVSRHFVQRLREGPRATDRDFVIDPGGPVYSNHGQPPRPSVPDPLDDISFIYFVRTLPLDSGAVYRFDRYFQPEGNPITIRVMAREHIHVPAGEFDAIVIEPQITTAGIFSRGGHARVWLSDDSLRLLLQLKSSLSFGSINLYLKSAVRPRTRSKPPRGGGAPPESRMVRAPRTSRAVPARAATDVRLCSRSTCR